MFDEVDPARAAAREDRHLRGDGRIFEALASLHGGEEVFHAANEFVAFFHDGKVGGEVRVEHFVKTESAETGDQFARDRRAGLEAEFLTDCDADGGGRADDDGLGRIVDGVPDFLDIADTGDGTDGAGVDALTAERAGRVGERDHAGGTDLRGEAAADARQGADGLDLIADGFATAAHDALGEVAHDGFAGVVDVEFVGFAFEFDIADAEFGSESLEFAVLVLRAGQAVFRVVGEHELENRAAGVEGALGVRPDFDAVIRDRRRAGGDENRARADAGSLDEADTAGRGLVGNAAAEIFAVAKGGDVDIQFLRGFKNGGAGGDGNLLAVDFYCYVTHF